MIYDFLTLASSAFVALEALHKSRTVGFQRRALCLSAACEIHTYTYQASTQYFQLKKKSAVLFSYSFSIRPEGAGCRPGSREPALGGTPLTHPQQNSNATLGSRPVLLRLVKLFALALRRPGRHKRFMKHFDGLSGKILPRLITNLNDPKLTLKARGIR